MASVTSRMHSRCCLHWHAGCERGITMKETALTTACTSGIGLHLAREFARHGHPLVLVAPDAGELRSLASQLTVECEIPAHPVAKDLEDPDAAEDIFHRLQRE